MPTKAEQVAQMADNEAVRITKSWQDWTAFLTTAARLYKYPYHEQLMIFAQRPDASACAEFDLWNNKMGRFIRRGSQGMALLNDIIVTFYLIKTYFPCMRIALCQNDTVSSNLLEHPGIFE